MMVRRRIHNFQLNGEVDCPRIDRPSTDVYRLVTSLVEMRPKMIARDGTGRRHVRSWWRTQLNTSNGCQCDGHVVVHVASALIARHQPADSLSVVMAPNVNRSQWRCAAVNASVLCVNVSALNVTTIMRSHDAFNSSVSEPSQVSAVRH